jgi:hypothetical protein
MYRRDLFLIAGTLLLGAVLRMPMFGDGLWGGIF